MGGTLEAHTRLDLIPVFGITGHMADLSEYRIIDLRVGWWSGLRVCGASTILVIEDHTFLAGSLKSGNSLS